jgi:hypothetical protein
MNLRHWTIAICVIVPTLLVVYDAVCAATPAADSITEIFRGWNRFSQGIVAGVLFVLWWHVFGWLPPSWR